MGIIQAKKHILLNEPHIATATGGVASFSTDMRSPLKSFKVEFTPVQEGSGDPYPPGATAQIWDEEWEQGYYDANGEKVASTSMFRNKNLIPVTPNTTYAFVGKENTTVGWRRYDANGDYLGMSCNSSGTSTAQTYGFSFTTDANTHYMAFFVNNLGTYANDISFNYPATDTTYHKYSNVRPITGWTGVTASQTGKSIVYFKQISIGPFNTFVNGQAAWQDTSSATDIAVRGKTITFSAYIDATNVEGTNYNGVRLWAKKPDGTWGYLAKEGTKIYNGSSGWSVLTLTTNSTYHTFAFGVMLQAGATASYPMVEIGDTRTDYEAYKTPTTFPISWTSQGMVYGGYVDLISGELVATHYLASVAKSGFDSGHIPASGGISYRNSFKLDFPKSASGVRWSTARTQQLFNIGGIANPYSEASYGNYIGVVVTQENVGTYLRISDSVYDAMGDNDRAEISYKLETPIVIATLTATQIKSLLGANSLWSDANGNVTVEYWKH